MDSDAKVISRVDAGIGWLIFNNPERRNALSNEMRLEIIKVIDRFAADESVRVVIMTGAGGKSFVSGADISRFEARRGSEEAIQSDSRMATDMALRFANFEKPLIARIEGYCIGAGLRLALHADIRVATRDSVFSVPAGTMAIAYGYESVQQLVRTVGTPNAREMLITGRRYNGDEARAMNLVHYSVERDELDQKVEEIATRIAANAPLSVRAAKLFIGASHETPEPAVLARFEEIVDGCVKSGDHAEAIRAFSEKRKPVFVGK